MEPVIQTVHLSKEYAAGPFARTRQCALQDVSLDLNEGEIVALLGPNGAGKTTFVRLLLGLAKPTHGNVLFPKHRDKKSRPHARIGFLPERFQAGGSWTPVSLLGFLGSLSGLRGRILRDRIEQTLGRVGLSHAALQHTRTFSKGMMLRLGLAQALLHEPNVLLLDEPTDGLDPLGRVEIRSLLFSLRGAGTAVLINSHELSEVELVADRIVILHHGALLARGKIQELLPGSVSFTIELGDQPDPALFCHAVQQGTSWFCTAATVDELTALLSLFQARGTTVRGVRSERTSLEDLFRSYIQ